MERIDVAVVGAGVMGAATARALAVAGREVVLFERFHVGHTRGSSHGNARIFRESYTDPSYVRMMREAITIWRELEDELGEQLLAVTGALNLGDVDPLIAAMAAAGSPFDILDRAGVAERFPGIDAGDRAVFDATAGVVAADRAWSGLVASARAHGAELRDGATVSLATADDDGVELRVGDARLRARVAVVTAGSWVRDVVEPIGIEVPVRSTRETVAYYDVGPVDAVPVLIHWADPLIYSLPTPDGTFKAGRHIAGPSIHPDSEGAADEASATLVDGWIAERFPERGVRRVHAETCLYTNATDEAFILERHGPLVVGSPCSGHGFKFAPLIGARLAALASA